VHRRFFDGGGTQWGTLHNERLLYAAKSKTWMRFAIPTLPAYETRRGGRSRAGTT
jgi:hypothetical protein